MGTSFTGRARKKKTHWSVKASDVLSRFLITFGGIGTIVAVSTVFIYLLWVAVPLTSPSELKATPAITVPDNPIPAQLTVDEYQLLGWICQATGHVDTFSLARGVALDSRNIASNHPVTASSFSLAGTEAMFGLDDGTLVSANMGFVTEFQNDADVSESIRSLKSGEIMEVDGGVWTRLPSGQLRSQAAIFSMTEPVPSDSSNAVILVDRFETASGQIVASLHAGNDLLVARVSEKKNSMTGRTKVTRSSVRVPIREEDKKSTPIFMALSGLGDSVTLVYENGLLVRYDLRDKDRPEFKDETQLLDDPSLSITACRYLLGRVTLLVGDSSGRIVAWFPVNAEQQEGDSRSRTKLVAAHTFPAIGSAVTAIATSQRTRIFAAGHADGSVRLFHVTSGKQLGHEKPEGFASPITGLTIAPKDDGLIALCNGQLARWAMDPRHPEASIGALFRPVWYEGEPSPVHVWQSSSGTDDFEPKFGLIPLIFGTLKATVFSLLFGVPIALLAAVFTSEFLNPRTRAIVKPLVEMMASLPSVVLGFLAALLFAPIVADSLTGILAAFVCVPAAFLTGSYLWQLLPGTYTLRHQGLRIPLLFLAVPVGVGAAMTLGPILEQVCFSGDIMAWLDGQVGGPARGLAAFLFPLSALATAILFGLTLNPWLKPIARSWERSTCAIVNTVKFLIGIVISVGIAASVSFLLSAAGFDPRGSLLDTYVQRNALVVGCVMGFAIIPIIYTIAEDALSSVPEHLRSASLASGATPWQTAYYVIIPTAMSGLFSAIMIGLGRAVGETMIVLMAAGNTPVMEWNIFNGFRTLSANIAVELPEAVRDSTHYRTLFLAALVLFLITFVLNTIAEIVRIRYRSKAVQL